MGVPGWPELAAWTASMASVRMVVTHCSSIVPGTVCVMASPSSRRSGARPQHAPFPTCALERAETVGGAQTGGCVVALGRLAQVVAAAVPTGVAARGHVEHGRAVVVDV